ncbi:membrane-bound lytic murein transglycosylase B precursor [mine drainage metagenome]|uniref:Membrane-bound lytic murein transglycosylase B n=1 Tax=mine drainage metagenome TaxID=410659 RepID=A0A1J5RER9_9ZZZZ
MNAAPIVFFLALCLAAPPAAAVTADSFARMPEVRAFIGEMQEKHGFDRAELARDFASTQPIAAVIKAVLPAPEPGVRSWAAYRARFVEARRINMGLRFWQQYRTQLTAARERFGVPEEIIVAIIGIESIYGRNPGHFNTFAALSTLAFDYPPPALTGTPPRSALFRDELEQLLLLARETHRDPLSYTGSYAGALGLPQFLPSSVRRYAVDAEHNGRIDLAASATDAIASIANFLSLHGWQKDAPVAVAATVAGNAYTRLLDQGIAPSHTPAEMAAFGVVSPGAPEQPAALIDLVTPQQPTEYRLGYRNFYVLTRYNRSSFYAMAVYDLARALRAARDQ